MGCRVSSWSVRRQWGQRRGTGGQGGGVTTTHNSARHGSADGAEATAATAVSTALGGCRSALECQRGRVGRKRERRRRPMLSAMQHLRSLFRTCMQMPEAASFGGGKRSTAAGSAGNQRAESRDRRLEREREEIGPGFVRSWDHSVPCLPRAVPCSAVAVQCAYWDWTGAQRSTGAKRPQGLHRQWRASLGPPAGQLTL